MPDSFELIEEVVQHTQNQMLRKTNPLYLTCEPLTKDQIVSHQVHAFIGHMIAVMHHNDGVGIAANQVAKNWQIFVINLDPSVNERYKFATGPLIDKVFINPKMMAHSEELVKFPHGCLSDQGDDSCNRMRRGWVATYEWIEYEALDHEGNAIKGRFEGVPAIVFQHELLHLRGFTYLDVAKEFTTFDQLTDDDRRPQLIQADEVVPVLLKKQCNK